MLPMHKKEIRLPCSKFIIILAAQLCLSLALMTAPGSYRMGPYGSARNSTTNPVQ